MVAALDGSPWVVVDRYFNFFVFAAVVLANRKIEAADPEEMTDVCLLEARHGS
jgi:hypothetical protein